MFELSATSLKKLKDDLRTFHGLFSCRCDGQYLEELFYRALMADPALNGDGNVNWISGSHTAGSDIMIAAPPVGISIKSGGIKKGRLEISGHRLTKYIEKTNNSVAALDALSQHLTDLRSDILLASPYERFASEEVKGCWRHTYRLFYLSKDLFMYPSGSGWQPFYGKKGGNTGVQAGFQYSTPQGLEMKITFSLSSQIWWFVPVSLCAAGPEINL